MQGLTRRRKVGAAVFAFVMFMALGGASCSSGSSKASKAQTSNTDAGIDRLIAAQQAHTMSYSPTIATINFWIDTWNVRGQLAFTYIRGGNPADDGYYVLDGPPVSMCAALTKTWTYEGTPQDGSDTLDQRVPRRSIDGVYYSGGQCASFYGRDASTGAYIEFSVGAGQNYFLSTQPLPKVSAKAFGPTDASMVNCAGATPDNVKAHRPDCAVK